MSLRRWILTLWRLKLTREIELSLSTPCSDQADLGLQRYRGISFKFEVLTCKIGPPYPTGLKLKAPMFITSLKCYDCLIDDISASLGAYKVITSDALTRRVAGASLEMIGLCQA